MLDVPLGPAVLLLALSVRGKANNAVHATEALRRAKFKGPGSRRLVQMAELSQPQVAIPVDHSLVL
jgi:ribosomal protein L16/L10AE